MFLKDHLKEIYNKASLDNDILMMENIVIKWVHRFGFDALNDLSLQNQLSKKEKDVVENQEEINLREEKHEVENQEENSFKSNYKKTSSNNLIINKNQPKKNKSEYSRAKELPLPNINNLRRWINNDKKAS